MISFKKYLIENNLSILLESKELHQFVNQHGDKILQTYGIKYDNSNISKKQQTQHKTDFIEKSLGIDDMPLHHKRWSLKQVVNGNIPHLEDLKSTVRDNLQKFEQNKDAHKINLDKVNNPTELFNIVQKHSPDETIKDLAPGHNYTLHGENEHWKVVQPHTQEASCALGAGTNWCTASKTNNMFTNYNKTGPLMVLLPKKPLYKGEKYQWHPEQFMNKEDKTVNINNKLPKLSLQDRPLPEFDHPSRSHMQLQVDLTDPKAPEQHLMRLINDPNSNFGNHLKKGLRSPHESVALAAVNHPEFDRHKHLGFALRSQHDSVALAALNHRDFDPVEDLPTALQSPNTAVALAAMKHRDFDPYEHLPYALESENTAVALAALKHRKFVPSDHLPVALRSQHDSVALAALNHRDFDRYEHLPVALQSKSELVRNEAKLRYPSKYDPYDNRRTP